MNIAIFREIIMLPVLNDSDVTLSQDKITFIKEEKVIMDVNTLNNTITVPLEQVSIIKEAMYPNVSSESTLTGSEIIEKIQIAKEILPIKEDIIVDIIESPIMEEKI